MALPGLWDVHDATGSVGDCVWPSRKQCADAVPKSPIHQRPSGCTKPTRRCFGDLVPGHRVQLAGLDGLVPGHQNIAASVLYNPRVVGELDFLGQHLRTAFGRAKRSRRRCPSHHVRPITRVEPLGVGDQQLAVASYTERWLLAPRFTQSVVERARSTTL